MMGRLGIYKNLLKAIFHNEQNNLQLFHAFTNAAELIEIKKRGFAFIHINKNGGSSVEKALNIKDQSHIPYYVLEDYYGALDAKKLKTFAVVRNPYDRIVSQYHYRFEHDQYGIKKKNISFKEFCRLAYHVKDEAVINFPLMFKTQYEWLQDHNGKIDHINYIGKFEQFDKTVADILELLNMDKELKNLPHKRKSNRGNWYDYFDEESKEIVHKYFQQDFEIFNYEK